MAENRLYSVASIAKLLDVPESTLHYWKNRFDDVLPSIGRGRNKRFRPEALDVFRDIGAMCSPAPPHKLGRRRLGIGMPGAGQGVALWGAASGCGAAPSCGASVAPAVGAT